MKMFPVLKMLIFSSLITFSLSSCVKRGCTNASAPNFDSSAKKDDGSCIDLTANIMGVYSGNIEMIDNSDGSSQTIAEQIIVTKIDDSHVIISSVGGEMPTLTASLKSATNNDLLINVASQSSAGATVSPYIIYSSDGQPCSGGYTYALSQISVIVTVDAGYGAFTVAFQGTR